MKKFEKNINYANEHFKGFEKFFMLWTPFIRIPKSENTKHSQPADLEEITNTIKRNCDVSIEVIFNEKFLQKIIELRDVASKTTQAMTSPIMRFLQIEEKLKSISSLDYMKCKGVA